MACHSPFLVQPPPHLLWRQLVVQTQEIEEITRTPPGIAIPMLVAPAKDLETWSHITALMVFFERARANPTTIECNVTTDYRFDILSLAPRLDTRIAFKAYHVNRLP
jgi:hypothetical protein